MIYATLLIGSAVAFSVQPTSRSCVVPRATVQPNMALTAPLTDDIFKSAPPVRVQGSTLKTWDIGSEENKRVQLSLRSEGRPIDANIELWTTPAYIPYKFRVYTEDGNLRPVDAVIETPVHPKTVAVYNTAQLEFPFNALVANTGMGKPSESYMDAVPEHVQGGKIISYTFGSEVNAVAVLLKSEDVGGRNMKAKIELTQGPNQVKQIFELYASSGYKNPFYAVIQTPGPDNTIRVINQNVLEFPFDAWVVPYETAS